jgi:transcriptional regulator with XRE-family HTH domain
MQTKLAAILLALKKNGYTIADVAKRIGYSREYLTRLKKSSDTPIIIMHELQKQFPDVVNNVLKTSQTKIREMPTDEYIVENQIYVRAMLNVFLSILAELYASNHREDSEIVLNRFRKLAEDQYEKERRKQFFLNGNPGGE